MKSKLALIVILFGWLMPVSFLLWGYDAHNHGLMRLLQDHALPLFAMLVFSPLIFTALGYFINERIMLLRKSERNYKDFYQNAPDGYHSLSGDGTFLDVNDTWLKMLGYGRDEVVGKMKLTDVLTAEGAQTFESYFPSLRKHGAIENLELDFRRKDGSLLHAIVNSTALYDENGSFLKSRTIIRDNTVKKGYERMLTHAAEEWRATFDSMPYGIMLIDGKHNIIRANKYIAQMAGYPIKKLLGRKCFRVIHGTERPVEGCSLDCTTDVGERKFEHYDPRLKKTFLITASPIFDEEGAISACVHSLIDITDIKNKETELLKSRNAFFNMLRDAVSDYRELKEIHKNLIFAFANAIDAKSAWTKGHSERVSNYSIGIARELRMSSGDIELLRIACLLHDIGKIGIFDGVLNKPDRLTDEEFGQIKRHPALGVEILRPIRQLETILPLVRHHHERLDGKGYPDGLMGEDIPLLARILHVADSFDAMTADRPYRESPGIEYAISELKRCSGSQFDSNVVEAFLRIIGKTADLDRERLCLSLN